MEEGKAYRKIGRAFRLFVSMAVLLAVVTGCAANGKQEEALFTEPVVTLKGIVLGNEPESGMDELYEQLDALTIPELNCIVRFDFIPWGNERKQINIAIASGEYDLIPGGVFSDYRILASKNAFLDLNDYLYLVPELAEHYSVYSETALSDCEINGGLYGIPQFGMDSIFYDTEGFFYREDLRREWGLPEITDIESMEAYLYRAKQEERYKDEPLITDNRIWQSLWIMLSKGKYLEVSSMMETPFVVVEADNPYVAVNRLETLEFKEVLSYIRKWWEDGIIESNLLAVSHNEGNTGLTMMLADQKPCETNGPEWSVKFNWLPKLTEEHPEWEYGFFLYLSTHEQYYLKNLSESSVISVSSKCSAPDTAVRLLSKIHTDQRYYDLFKYGVEGIHYNLVDNMVNYNGIFGDNTFGLSVITDFLLTYDENPVSVQWYEEVEVPIEEWRKEVLRVAKTSPIGRFTFVTAGLESELEKMENAKVQYFQPLVCGYMEDCDAGLEKAIEALNRAGLFDYMEVLQEQLNQYKEITGRQ